jgi:PHD/YefM family antitoxin component YafN of YafNO toxin-antitoxin module
MPTTILSSREFNQDAGRAKRAALNGPVIITDRGKPTHVLLSIEDYRKLTGGDVSLAEAAAQSGAEDFDFTPPRLGGITRPADLE